MLHSTTVWGYFEAIFYSHLLIHCYRERLLLPLFKSKPVSLVVWVGGRLEAEIYKEGVGCVLIVASLLLTIVLFTMDVIPWPSRLFLFLMVGVYLCFRGIALTKGASVYIQQVDSTRNLKSTVDKFDVDDRLFVPMFFLLLLAGVMGICLIGINQTPLDLQRKGIFLKGCTTLKILAVKEWGRLKALILTLW